MKEEWGISKGDLTLGLISIGLTLLGVTVSLTGGYYIATTAFQEMRNIESRLTTRLDRIEERLIDISVEVRDSNRRITKLEEKKD